MNTPSLKDKTKHSKENDNGLNSIFFAGGEKGGVGKTLFTKLFMQYAEAEVDSWKEKLSLVDAEPNIASLEQVYSDCEKVIFSDSKFDFDQPNRILDLVESKSIIVNLPASVARKFDQWMVRLDLLGEDIKQYYNEIVYFYVTDGCVESISFFTEHVKRYKDTGMKTCLVFNPGRCSNARDFRYLEDDKDFIKVIQESKVSMICLPELANRHQYPIGKSNKTYRNYYMENNNLNISDKRTIKSFIDDSSEIFKKIYPNKISSAEGLEQIVKEQEQDRKNGKILVGQEDRQTLKRKMF